jgi:hypothetical protein
MSALPPITEVGRRIQVSIKFVGPEPFLSLLSAAAASASLGFFELSTPPQRHEGVGILTFGLKPVLELLQPFLVTLSFFVPSKAPSRADNIGSVSLRLKPVFELPQHDLVLFGVFFEIRNPPQCQDSVGIVTLCLKPALELPQPLIFLQRSAKQNVGPGKLASRIA